MAGLDRSRVGLRWVVGVLAVAALLHGVFWLNSTRRLGTLMEEQAQVLRGQGWRVVLGAARPRGWPSCAGLQFGPTSIEGGGFAWRADRATIDTPLRWHQSMFGTPPGTVHVQAEGQSIRFGSSPARPVMSQGLRIEVLGDAVTLAGTGVGVANLFEAEALQAQFAPDGLALAVRRLKLFEVAWTGAPVVETLALHASATPAVRWSGHLHAAALAWRQAAGVIDLSDLTLAMGRARAVGKAKVWLDDASQPRLDGTMHVTNYEAGLDDLAMAGALSRRTVLAAKAVLGLLAAPAPDGGADIPVQIAAGVLVVTGFPLLRMPALKWPTEASGP